MPIKLDKSLTDISKIKEHWADQQKKGNFRGYKSGNLQGSFYSIGKDGEYELRIIAMLKFQTGSHWNVIEGNDGKKGMPVKCPRLYDNSDCPVCEYIEELEASNDEEKIELANRMKARARHPMIVVDMDEAREEGIATPKIYEAPISVYFGILEASTSTRFDMGDFMDLDQGRSVIVKRKKNKNGFTEYSVMFNPSAEPLEYELKDIPDYEALLKPRSVEDILYALENGEMPPKQETEKEEREVRRPKKYDKGLPAPKTRGETNRKPLARKVEEPQETEEEEEELIEEVYEKPVERTVRKPLKSVTRTKTESAPKKTGKLGLSSDLKERLAAIKRKNS